MCVVQVTEESGQWNANPSLLCTSCGNVVLTPLLLYTHSNSIASLLWSRISKIRIAGAGEKARVKSMAVLTEDLGSVPALTWRLQSQEIIYLPWPPWALHKEVHTCAGKVPVHIKWK